ncbi:hypothetical protein CEXT_139811 [Caerostris extrusa]|uniref:Uncharacterized protein n=1 Tax=Caerostris extrusa TaxID=172846 RepID=A0AAV4X3X9_CAEEX|nr:hypothetical protein CEXT_139811 [Caerostris extrusa]
MIDPSFCFSMRWAYPSVSTPHPAHATTITELPNNFVSVGEVHPACFSQTRAFALLITSTPLTTAIPRSLSWCNEVTMSSNTFHSTARNVVFGFSGSRNIDLVCGMGVLQDSTPLSHPITKLPNNIKKIGIHVHSETRVSFTLDQFEPETALGATGSTIR